MNLKLKNYFIKTMFYEIFLIIFGIYLEQTYHLPSIALNLRRLQTQYQEQYQGNEQGENFLPDFLNLLLNNKKK